MPDTPSAAGEHDSFEVPQHVADRLADLLHADRADHDAPVAPAAPSQSPSPQARLLRAALNNPDVSANSHAGSPADAPAGRSKKRTNVKRLANPEPHGRPGLMRRPAWEPEPDPVEPTVEHDAAVDPSQLPPPLRRGFNVADTTIGQAHAPVEVFASQIRSGRAKKARNGSGQPQPGPATTDFGFGQSPPNSSQILDMRVPGRVKGDSPFLLPLLPSMFIAAISTYVWFQSSIRLLSYLPLAPILIGVAIGGVMRLGTRSVDFARVIFAVILTAMATFWGHAATKDFGPLDHVAALKIRWSDLPRVANPVGIISTFHATAEQSLGAATIMFAGLIAAGLVASLTPK